MAKKKPSINLSDQAIEFEHEKCHYKVILFKQESMTVE